MHAVLPGSVPEDNLHFISVYTVRPLKASDFFHGSSESDRLAFQSEQIEHPNENDIAGFQFDISPSCSQRADITCRVIVSGTFRYFPGVDHLHFQYIPGGFIFKQHIKPHRFRICIRNQRSLRFQILHVHQWGVWKKYSQKCNILGSLCRIFGSFCILQKLPAIVNLRHAGDVGRADFAPYQPGIGRGAGVNSHGKVRLMRLYTRQFNPDASSLARSIGTFASLAARSGSIPSRSMEVNTSSLTFLLTSSRWHFSRTCMISSCVLPPRIICLTSVSYCVKKSVSMFSCMHRLIAAEMPTPSSTSFFSISSSTY